MGNTRYFSYFNNVTVNDQNIKNIFKQYTLNEDYFGKKEIFKTYIIKDGDTPETLAYKIYKDKRYFWIFMLSNSMKDYFYDWPLTDRELRAYSEKYVEDIITGISEDLSTGETTESKFVDVYGDSGEDEDDYLTVKNRLIESTYILVYDENEDKREIQYLNPQLLPRFLYLMENKI